MKKLNKKDYYFLSIILSIIIGFIIFLRIKGYAFGSNVDWLSQHSVLPDYFRRMFFESGQILPNFAFNLGMGQNIYYFSYYGLLSPLVLLSYLFPFIPMFSYIQIISLIMVLLGAYLLYRWINNKYNSKIAFIITLMYVLLAPIIYHSHRHIMFVNYLPFLIGTLIAIDNYFINKKAIPIVINVFLLIMTSYFFGPVSLIVIGIYTIYKILQKNKQINCKSFLPLLKIIYFCIVAILLAAILLVPTIYTTFVGRQDTNVTSNIWQLLIPKLSYTTTFYYSYSAMGLSFIYIVSLISFLLKKKKENKFLAIILILLLTFPICNFILNVFMYVDGKIFLSFIPLSLLVIADFLNDLFKNKYNFKKQIVIIIPVIIFMIYSAIGYSYAKLLWIDIPLLLTTLTLIYLYKKPNLIFIPILVISSICFIRMNKGDDYSDIIARGNSNVYKELVSNISKDNVHRTSDYTNQLYNVNQIYTTKQLSPSFYSSTSNKHYFNFVRNIFQNEIINRDNLTVSAPKNILYNIYTGVKYIITNESSLKGYNLIQNKDGISIYENEDVLPIGYASDKIMSLREFNTLSYPQNIDALLNYVIVNKSISNVYKSNIKMYETDFNIETTDNLKYEVLYNTLYVSTDGYGQAKLKLTNPVSKDDVFIIRFKIKYPKKGTACSTDISINNVTNALSCSDWKYFNNNYTFEYVLSSDKNIDTLNVVFSPGKYEIENLELYTIKYDSVKNIKKQISEANLKTSNKDNVILTGDIDVKEDGYFKLTIPYEKRGFKIYLDDDLIKYEKVDNTFIGFPIAKGYHTITIKYQSPYFTLGIILSIIGLILLEILFLYKYVNKYFYNKFMTIKKYLIKAFKKIWKFLKDNTGYVHLFLSLYLLDISLRFFYYSQIKFYHCYKFVPNLFSIIWIVLILSLTKLFKSKVGKSIYILYYVFYLIIFLVQSIYFSYFTIFFDFSVMILAGEGIDYLDTILANVKIWVIFISCLSIYLTIKGLKNIKHNDKFNTKKLFIVLVCFTLLHFTLPYLLGNIRTSVEWDDWRNPRTVYNTFNDHNKSMMVSGLFEYTVRDYYVSFIRNNEKITPEEEKILKENFDNPTVNEKNNYSGILAGKNLILIQLESIDNFLITPEIMPTTYELMKNSINFTNHYSFTSGGGSTFNSEYMVNTGYSTAYNYNLSAYSFSRNDYSYSLPNLLKTYNYVSNAFHMNTGEYYSRTANYKSFGYNNFYSLKNQKVYKENTNYWLDRELILNEEFNKLLFKNENNSLFMNYIITYSAHMPFNSSKGTCSLLTNIEGLTELECLKLQAKETDYFIKLLLEDLAKKDMLKNTVIVAFSDHYLYTLEDKTILDKHKKTDSQLINHTPFFIWSNGDHKKTIKKINSQLDILPTILNLMGVDYYQNYYLGSDILSPNYSELVFFPDGSWYNGSTYIKDGEYSFGKKLSEEKINQINIDVKRKMMLNDAVMKSNYFSKINSIRE